jgi:hypothetical protein
MAVVSIEADALRVTFRGIHRLWTLRRRLTVPLAHIIDARRDASLASSSPGWRLLGAELPGVVAAGRFVKDGERAFWDVVDPDKAVVIELRGERYARLVLEVDEPDETVDTFGVRCASAAAQALRCRPPPALTAGGSAAARSGRGR